MRMQIYTLEFLLLALQMSLELLPCDLGSLSLYRHLRPLQLEA